MAIPDFTEMNNRATGAYNAIVKALRESESALLGCGCNNCRAICRRVQTDFGRGLGHVIAVQKTLKELVGNHEYKPVKEP